MSDEQVEVPQEEVEEPSVLGRETVTADYAEFAEQAADEPAQETEEVPDWRAQLEAERKALEKREKDLNRGFEEIARREKLVERFADNMTPAQAAAAASQTDVPELSPEAQLAVDSYFQQKYGSQLNQVDVLYNDLAESELQSFAEKQGIDPEELKQVIIDNNLQPNAKSLTDIRASLKKASLIREGSTVNREAIAAEERAKVLRELAAKGIQVEGVKPKRAADPGPNPNPDFDMMTPEQRIAWYEAKEIL
jgi:hypothetical protein